MEEAVIKPKGSNMWANWERTLCLLLKCREELRIL